MTPGRSPTIARRGVGEGARGAAEAAPSPRATPRFSAARVREPRRPTRTCARSPCQFRTPRPPCRRWWTRVTPPALASPGARCGALRRRRSRRRASPAHPPPAARQGRGRVQGRFKKTYAIGDDGALTKHTVSAARVAEVRRAAKSKNGARACAASTAASCGAHPAAHSVIVFFPSQLNKLNGQPTFGSNWMSDRYEHAGAPPVPAYGRASRTPTRGGGASDPTQGGQVVSGVTLAVSAIKNQGQPDAPYAFARRRPSSRR